ncbi:hypothetical protein ACCS70_29375 [Rhizobium ruizarguesonis]
MKSKIDTVSLHVDLTELLDLYSKALESGDLNAVELAGIAVTEAAQAQASHIQMLTHEAMAIRRLK